MKTSYELNEQDIKNAIICWLQASRNINVTTVALRAYHADPSDPRDYSYVSATAEENED
jgi:hypothetical protein